MENIDATGIVVKKKDSRTVNCLHFPQGREKDTSKVVNQFFPLRLVVSRDTAHEDAFLSRYRTLLIHAIRLTRGNRDLADDLLQDAFLRFTEAKVDLREIDNLDAYLISMVKYLHLAHIRREMRDPLGELSAVDYESAELSLSSAPASILFFVYEQLLFICEYAFARRDEVRSQSLLLLRFFHGYSLDELALLAGNSKPTLRKWIQEGQTEVRAALKARPAGGKRQKSEWADHIRFAPRHKEFLEALREHLLSFGGKRCPARWELEQMYSDGQEGEIPTELLGHLAVCRPCLDGVNRRLGLPSLAERHLAEMDGRGRWNGPGSGGGSSTGSFDLCRARRRAELNFNHEPHKLLICVDGIERAEHDLALPTNRFVLKLAAEERVHLVEVVSEQGVCLLSFFLPDTETVEPLEVRRFVQMSGERTISATLRYGETWPSVEVTYHDPENAAVPSVTSPSAPQSREKRRLLLRRLLSWVRAFFRKSTSKMNPLLATATVLAVASVLFFVLWTRSVPGISPHDLLLRAQKQEASVAQRDASGVIVQRVRIKTLSRTAERTLYRDIQRKRRSKEQTLDASDAKLRAELALAGVDWDDPLSPTDYREWRNREFIERDSVKRMGDNLLTLTTNARNSEVVSESLTVRTSDFHTVSKTVELRDYGTIEIAELNYSILPWSAVRDDWFEPPPGAVSDVPSGLHSPRPLRFPQSLTQNEIDTAELAARLVLAELKADTTERIRIAPGANGVQISGIVATDERKREIESRLHAIPHVIVSIATFEEMQDRDNAGDETTSIQASSSVAAPSPLAKFLLEKGRSPGEVTELSQRLMNAALAVKQHANAIHELLGRFSHTANLSAQAQADLERLIDNHKSALLAALDEEQQNIARTGMPVSAGPASPEANNLMSSEEENAALCAQLTTGSDAPADVAKQLLPELASIAARLHTVALRLTEEQINSTANTTTATVPPRADKQQ